MYLLCPPFSKDPPFSVLHSPVRTEPARRTRVGCPFPLFETPRRTTRATISGGVVSGGDLEGHGQTRLLPPIYILTAVAADAIRLTTAVVSCRTGCPVQLLAGRMVFI